MTFFNYRVLIGNLQEVLEAVQEGLHQLEIMFQSDIDSLAKVNFTSSYHFKITYCLMHYTIISFEYIYIFYHLIFIFQKPMISTLQEKLFFEEQELILLNHFPTSILVENYVSFRVEIRR